MLAFGPPGGLLGIQRPNKKRNNRCEANDGHWFARRCPLILNFDQVGTVYRNLGYADYIKPAQAGPGGGRLDRYGHHYADTTEYGDASYLNLGTHAVLQMDECSGVIVFRRTVGYGGLYAEGATSGSPAGGFYLTHNGTSYTLNVGGLSTTLSIDAWEGEPWRIAWSWKNGGDVRVAVNGRAFYTGTHTLRTLTHGLAILGAGDTGSSYSSYQHNQYLFAIAPGETAMPELVELSRFPSQLLKSRRPVLYYPQDAGGGTTSVSRNADLRWNLAVLAARQADLRWHDYAAIAALADLRWNDVGRITNAADLRWHVQQLAAALSDLRWNDRALAAKAGDLRWHVANAVARSSDVRWNDYAIAARQADIQWNTIARVAAQGDFRWNVNITLSAAANQIDLRWNVRNVVAKQGDLRWNLFIKALNAIDLRWDDIARVVDTLALAWDDRQTAGKTVDAQWAVRQTAGKQTDLRWDDRAQAARSLAALWDGAGRVAATRDLRWIIANVVTEAIEARWADLINAGAQFQVVWHDMAAAGKTVTVTWSIVGQIDTAKMTTVYFPAEDRSVTFPAEDRSVVFGPEDRSLLQ